MTLKRCSVLDLGLPETVEILNRGFTGYHVPLSFTLPGLLQSLRIDGIDAAASQIALRDGAAVGVALIARQGWRCRLAAMAIAPEARGQGVGRWLMAELMNDAQRRGERSMVLEVIEANTPAVALYEHCGFQTVRRLVSYQRSAAVAQPVPTNLQTEQLREIDVYIVATLVAAHGTADLPWQLAGPTLARMGPPSRAYQLDDAYALISDPSAANIGLRSLLVTPKARGRGQAVQLLHALAATFPNKPLQVPALFPEQMGGLFAQAGFALGELAQLQMALRLV